MVLLALDKRTYFLFGKESSVEVLNIARYCRTPQSKEEEYRQESRIYNQAVPPSYAQQARSFEQWSSTVACLSLLSKRVLHHCLIKRKLNIKNLLEFHLTCPIGAQSMWTLKREAVRPAHMVYGTGQIER